MIPLATRLVRLGILAGFILFFVGPAGFAAPNSAWFTRVWQTDDGLPNNHVTAIVQGRDGFLWVGTVLGLARFDGIRFTPFAYSNSSSNEDRGVTQLLPDQAGGLWIRTRRGQMICLSPDFSQVAPMGNDLPARGVMAAFEDQDGSLWVASENSIWQVKNGRATRLTGHQNIPPSGYTETLTIDSDGNLWMSKGNSVYLFRHGRFEAIANTTYQAHLEASRSGGVWIASGKELFKCDTNGTLQDCGSFSPADIHAGSTTILEDHIGAVWIGTSSGGLFRHSESGFEKIGTSHPDISSLAEDREGNIWVGTVGGGLDRVSTRGVQLETMATGPSPVAIQSICEDTNGVLWGATQNGLLVSRVNGEWQPALTNAPWTNAVDCVAADKKGTLWIGTRNSGLYCWRDGQFSNWDTNQGLASRVIMELLPVSDGDIWIAGQAPTGLQYLHDGQLLSLKVPRAVRRITALAGDTAGNIWVGSEMGVLLRVKGGHLVNETAPAQPSNQSILSLFPTADGALWIGYEGAGLGRLKDGHFSRVGTDQGLSDDYISQIVADGEGWLWFGAERGIFKARRDELESVMDGHADRLRSINYGQNEGLFSVEADSVNVSPNISPTAIRSRDGRLWIPMRKAIAVVDPKILRVNPAPPPVLLSQVIVDGQTSASYGGLNTNPAVANLMVSNILLQLPPAHRHLEFDFTAINLSAPENIRFRYQLVGFDSDWIETGKQRSAEYSRLTAGDYQFRVEAANGDGSWNENPATLTLNIQPFFWQTWWFRVGALLLFTSCVIAIVRYISFRRFQAELRLIEQRAALDKERTRIARDLHDDLGCSLNKVALTLDMTQRGLETEGSVNGKIQHCSTMVRQVAKSVDEIVWAINPRNDTLRYMVDYISQFTVEFLHAAGISCRVDLPDHLPDHVVSPEDRHNLFLVVKEALNNIARHARASEVQLQVSATANQVAVSIADNGCGFERVPDNASCDGLRNMRQRMEEIGGQFQLETRPGNGTRVTFVYSWPVNSGKPGNPNMPYPFTCRRSK